MEILFSSNFKLIICEVELLLKKKTLLVPSQLFIGMMVFPYPKRALYTVKFDCLPYRLHFLLSSSSVYSVCFSDQRLKYLSR